MREEDTATYQVLVEWHREQHWGRFVDCHEEPCRSVVRKVHLMPGLTRSEVLEG